MRKPHRRSSLIAVLAGALALLTACPPRPNDPSGGWPNWLDLGRERPSPIPCPRRRRRHRWTWLAVAWTSTLAMCPAPDAGFSVDGINHNPVAEVRKSPRPAK